MECENNIDNNCCQCLECGGKLKMLKRSTHRNNDHVIFCYICERCKEEYAFSYTLEKHLSWNVTKWREELLSEFENKILRSK